MATPDRPPIKDRPDRLDLPEPEPDGGARPDAGPKHGAGVRGPLDAMRWGLGAAWSCRRILFFILAANLLIAVIVLFPFLGPMKHGINLSPEAERIGRSFDPSWWFDLTYLRSFLLIRTVSLMGLAAFLMVFLSTFFAGGLLEALKHGRSAPLSFEPMPDPAYGNAVPQWRSAAPGPATLQVFLKESARHFPRFLVLLLLSLPLYALVQVVFNEMGGKAVDWLFDRIEDERLALVIDLAKSLAFVAAFHAVSVLFEYARAVEVLRPGTTLLAMLATPFRLLARRPAAFLGIEASAFVLQAAALAAFMPLDRLLQQWTLVAATAGFAATQIFIFTRLLIRAGANAAQLRLAEDLLGQRSRP